MNLLLTVLCLAALPLAALADPRGRVRVLDADTWEVGATTVRLHGIDAPETDQTCTDAAGVDWACGAWASQQVRDRYQGRVATCRRVTTDRYGRTVARCVIDGRDAGRDLVADGLAFAYRRYSMEYDLEEKAAAINQRGLHASRMQSPAAHRAARNPQAPPPQGCDIKGNISAGGIRIFHVPGQQHYRRTRISPARGERWFCSQAEARAAGWRKARR